MAREKKEIKSNQFRAMFFKNASFLKRQKCSIGVQIAIPLVLVLILVIINYFVKHQIESQSNGGESSSYNSGDSSASYVIYESPKVNHPNTFYNYSYLNGFLYDVNLADTDLGTLDKNGNGSGLWGSVHQQSQLWYGFAPYNSPYFVSVESVDEMNGLIVAEKELVSTNSSIMFYSGNVFPIAGAVVNEFSQNKKVLDVLLTVEAQNQYQMSMDPSQLLFAMNTMSSAFVNYVLGGNVSIQTSATDLPSFNNAQDFDIASLLGGSFYPFALSFILPLFIFTIVIEKQEKLREISLMMGLKIRNYWIMTYLFNYLLYAIIVTFVVGVSSIAGFAVFVKGSQFGMFLFLFGWGHAQITFAFFLSTFFQRTRTASIFGYFMVIIAVNLNGILSFQMFKDSPPPQPYYFIPLLAFNRGMSVLSFSCGVDLCPDWSQYTWDFEITKIIFWLYIDALVYLILALYLDQVLPKEFGVPSHPLFFLKPIKNLFKKSSNSNNIDSSYGKSYDEKSSLITNNSEIDIVDPIGDEEIIDDDVKAEKDMIVNGNYKVEEMNVVIKGLSKLYPGRPKPALDNLYLTIKKGDVLGLLGPNGAGKSTTISILTGLYQPTSGTAIVDGYDIRSEMDLVHSSIGICPQFDIFWEDLSCTETLLYYARLKGIPIERERQSVENVLKEVGLFEARDRLVKQLSGGMKRRLSFAVAMSGDSSIIFLDEPTTGLDVATKKELWQTIHELKKNRSIVLITHSIEEADVLSNRIAIISQGKLQCLGTQQHLKNKFGDGYSVKINIEEAYKDTHNPTDLIHQFSPSAIFTEHFNCSYSFRLPKETVISEFYEFLVKNQKHGHIQQFAFGQTSLEDLFIKITANDDTVN